jgi:hypothetical protein
MIKTLLASTAIVVSLVSLRAQASDLFSQGLQDRTAWEMWFSSLSGDERAGAEYWAGQRSLPNPGNCIGTPDFQTGCNEARAKLTGPDTLRKSRPEYKAGWNSYVHTETAASQAAPTPISPPIDQEKQAREQEAAAEAAQAKTARMKAEMEQREIAAREAEAEAERAKAEVDRRKAQQEAESQRADARLHYGDLLAGEIRKEKERGYTPYKFEDYLLDKKDLAENKTKIAIHGFYKYVGRTNLLLRSASSDVDNYDEILILLTDNAERDTRKYFLTCRDNAEICSVTVLGTVVKCALTDNYGANTDALCFAVDNSWNVPEPGNS